MRKAVTLLLIMGLFWGCYSGENKKEEAAKTEMAEQHDTAVTRPGLNKGAKWKSDAITDKNVVELQTIATRFTRRQNKTLADYVTVANDLQSGINKMINECRMQGDDHEALHQWLKPLLKNVNSLKVASSKEEAQRLFGDIDQQLIIYNQYFENP